MRKTLIAIAGLALAAAPLSAAHAVSEGHEVTASVPQSVDLGKTVTIKGHVSGVSVKGYTVDIHAGYSAGQSGGLIHIGHADVHSSGNFSKSYKAPEGGTYSLNVEVDDKHGDAVGAAEGAAIFRVFRWTALQNVNMTAGDQPENAAGKTTGKKVKGAKWTHELYLRSGATLSFSWEYYNPCTKIQSYVGISDSAPNGATANHETIQADNDPLVDINLTRGAKARHFTRDLDPEHPELSLHALFGEGPDTVGSKVIFGEPKAYCAVG